MKTRIVDSKRCPRCKEIRSKDEYYTRIDHGNRVLQGYCKHCERIRHKENYWNDPEKYRRMAKKNSFRHGRGCTAEADNRSNKRKKAIRLSLRLIRANLLIKLCMKEYEVATREELNGRSLLGNYEQCAVMAIWLIRKLTFLHRDAIAELFNCATSDVDDRIKKAVKENNWYYGDISFIDKWKKIRETYYRIRPTDHTKIEILPYESFSKAQLGGRENVKYVAPKEPPTKNITTDQLLETVCWYYSVSWDDFLHDSKSRGNVPKARHVAMYLLNKYFSTTLPTLVDIFSRDDSTIRNSIKVGRDIIRNNHGSLFYELHKRFPTPIEENLSEETLVSTHIDHTS